MNAIRNNFGSHSCSSSTCLVEETGKGVIAGSIAIAPSGLVANGGDKAAPEAIPGSRLASTVPALLECAPAGPHYLPLQRRCRSWCMACRRGTMVRPSRLAATMIGALTLSAKIMSRSTIRLLIRVSCTASRIPVSAIAMKLLEVPLSGRPRGTKVSGGCGATGSFESVALGTYPS